MFAGLLVISIIL